MCWHPTTCLPCLRQSLLPLLLCLLSCLLFRGIVKCLRAGSLRLLNIKRQNPLSAPLVTAFQVSRGGEGKERRKEPDGSSAGSLARNASRRGFLRCRRNREHGPSPADLLPLTSSSSSFTSSPFLSPGHFNLTVDVNRASSVQVRNVLRQAYHDSSTVTDELVQVHSPPFPRLCC